MGNQISDGHKHPGDATTPVGYIPQSNSIQPLLQDENQDYSKITPLAENLMSMDTPQQTPTSTQPPVSISCNNANSGSRSYYCRDSIDDNQVLNRPDNLLRYPQHYTPNNRTIIPTIRQMANQAVPLKSPSSTADITGVTLNPSDLVDQVGNRNSNSNSKNYINLGVGKTDQANHKPQVTISGSGAGGGYLNNDSEISC
ncbi:uncharacterized protein LOC113389070 [Ctenocephalides felis]|uniref:uncharacterized protein LOC113389070 n=1 Tax=Ctenocephalides felis TaxID=7515 RepID=UPI000E6E108E|nr:uncharacterized protein LOC113389070 [Ctenocephalides felis]